MPNTEKIKLRLADKGLSQKAVSELLGIAQPTFSQKLNGLRPFYLSEAEQLASLLDIPDSEFGDYFFNKKLRSAI